MTKKHLWAICLCIIVVTGCRSVQSPPPDGTTDMVRQAAVRYMMQRDPVDKPVTGSLQVLLDQPFGDGQVIIFSYALGPGNQAGRPGDRVVTLLPLDKAGNQAGGGAQYEIVFLDNSPIQIAWTLMYVGGRDWSTLYGPVNDPRVATVQLVDGTGVITTVPVSGSRAWFLARPYDGPSAEGVARAYPAVVRALDAGDRVLYEKHL